MKRNEGAAVVITKRPFGLLADGTAVSLYTMTAQNGTCVEVLDYGVTIRGICVPDRQLPDGP